jgi:hypothetical protein
MAWLWSARDHSVVPFGPYASLRVFNDVEYEDNAFESGGFGSVHRIASLGGTEVEGLLLKIIHQEQNADHAFATIRLLHEKLWARCGEELTADHPELLGLPFRLFRADDAMGNTVVAMVMRDLVQLGFADLGSDEWDSTVYFTDIPLQSKIHLAYQFARAFELLDAIGFVHADLKDRSVFVNVEQPQLALIDFDSGFHPAVQSAAATIGALSHWAGFRMREWIKSGSHPGQLTKEERIEEERWSLAAGLFEVLIGVAPYFFLRDGDETSIAEYLKDHDWLEGAQDHSLLNPGNFQALEVVRELMEMLDEAGGKDLVAAFRKTFKRGFFKPAARPTAAEWKALLQPLVSAHVGAPVVSSFSGSPAILRRQDEELALTWAATHYRVIYLNGVQQLLGSTRVVLQPGAEQRYHLKAVNDQGESTAQWSVDVHRAEPVIQWFRLKRWVDVEKNLAELEWSVDHAIKVVLTPGGVELPLQGSAVVTVEADGNVQLKATGGFGHVVTMQMVVRKPRRPWSLDALVVGFVSVVLCALAIWWMASDRHRLEPPVAKEIGPVQPVVEGFNVVEILVVDRLGDVVTEPVTFFFSGDTAFTMSSTRGSEEVRLPRRYGTTFVRAELNSGRGTDLLLMNVTRQDPVVLRLSEAARSAEKHAARSVTNEASGSERGSSSATGRGDGSSAPSAGGLRTVFYDLNGDGVGGAKSIQLAMGKPLPPGYVSVGGDTRDNERLRLVFETKPNYLVPSGCGGSGSAIVVRVLSPEGNSVPNCTITLGMGVPVNWITAPKVTRESTGARSVRTGADGRVSIRLSPPARKDGARRVELSFAISGATARMSSIITTTLPVCPDCAPCYY